MSDLEDLESQVKNAILELWLEGNKVFSAIQFVGVVKATRIIHHEPIEEEKVILRLPDSYDFEPTFKKLSSKLQSWGVHFTHPYVVFVSSANPGDTHGEIHPD